jgi:aconitate hydratase
VGTDSHTTMINGLGVLGWGVGGIEAEAAMLGQPISMLIPEVVGFKLTGRLGEGITATDLVLTVVEMLRKKGVVGKFVEFYGDGLDDLPLADRATIANMAPEYGATCGFFPIDEETINYLKLTSRPAEVVALVEAYAKANGCGATAARRPGLHRHPGARPGLGGAEPGRAQAAAGPGGHERHEAGLRRGAGAAGAPTPRAADRGFRCPGTDYDLGHGDVVIAAITSCTNTSNPAVMLGAGLVARNALVRGLKVKPWVKTSLAPGSKVVTEYLAKAGLQDDLDALGFNLVGYGCTTCIGNSGPLPEPISAAIEAGDLVVSRCCRATATSKAACTRKCAPTGWPRRRWWWPTPSPAPAASTCRATRSARMPDGKDVFLKDIWPSNAEIADVVRRCPPRCSSASTPTCSPARRPGRTSTWPTPAPTAGRNPPTSSSRRSSRWAATSISRSRSAAPGCWRCSATR